MYVAMTRSRKDDGRGGESSGIEKSRSLERENASPRLKGNTQRQRCTITSRETAVNRLILHQRPDTMLTPLHSLIVRECVRFNGVRRTGSRRSLSETRYAESV